MARQHAFPFKGKGGMGMGHATHNPKPIPMAQGHPALTLPLKGREHNCRASIVVKFVG